MLTIAVADFSHLKEDAFWIALDNQSLCTPMTPRANGKLFRRCRSGFPN